MATTISTPDVHEGPAAPRGRWDGIVRPYGDDAVRRLRGTVAIEFSLARLGAERLWELLTTRDFVRSLGALTGNQAV